MWISGGMSVNLQKFCICLLVGMLLSDAMVYSDDHSFPQSELVVSASRISSSPTEIAVNSSIITLEQINSGTASNMVDLLRFVPGLHIDKPGSLGGVSSIYLRGADPNYTLVLIDGIPLNDPTNSRGGSFDVSTIDLLSIERVEVLRGPQSSLYGADAIAGVINFVTLGGSATPKYSFYSGFDSHGGDINRALLQGPLGRRGGFAVGGTYLDEGERLEGSSFQNSEANAKANLNISDEGRLSIALRVSESDGTTFPDDSGGPAFAKLRTVDSRQATELSAGLHYSDEISNVWRYSVVSSSYRRRELFKSPGIAPGLRSSAGIPVNSSETTFERVNLQLSTGYDWTQHLQTLVGIDFKREFGTNNGRLSLGGAPLDTRFVLKRSSVSWFGESRLQLQKDWFVNGSARLDFLDDYQVVKSFAVGTVYELALTNTLIKVNWGEGFKLPSFYALGNDLVGDPNLKPELSRSLDLSAKQDLLGGMSALSLSVFKNRFQNNIDFDVSTNKLVNRSVVSIWGGEANVTVRHTPRLLLGSHLAFAHTNIRGVNEKLKNRVKWKGGMNAVWSLDKFLNFSLSLLRVGQVFSSSIPTGDQILGAYNLLDIAGQYAVNDTLQATVSIDNLLGVRVQDAVGFVSREPTARISVKYQY